MNDSEHDKVEHAPLVLALVLLYQNIDGVYRKNHNADDTHRYVEYNVILHKCG